MIEGFTILGMVLAACIALFLLWCAALLINGIVMFFGLILRTIFSAAGIVIIGSILVVWLVAHFHV